MNIIDFDNNTSYTPGTTYSVLSLNWGSNSEKINTRKLLKYTVSNLSATKVITKRNLNKEETQKKKEEMLSCENWETVAEKSTDKDPTSTGHCKYLVLRHISIRCYVGSRIVIRSSTSK